MFKKILVPISDDMVTAKSMKKISDLAGADSALVTFVYVSDPRAPFIYTRKASDYKISDARHKKSCESHAQELFAKAEKLLDKNLTCKKQHVFKSVIFEGILEAAKNSKADAIMMASHKRVGLKGVFIGSDTHAVIVHTNLPVIVV
jgi:nucleotide-binding universal stress UspA family protein